MLIKLDMSNTYHRVEWVYIGTLMFKMGFCPKWIQWVMDCLSSVSSSFNLNGQKVGLVRPTKGIRQGVPLSSYLFLIYAEVFSNMIDRAIRERGITRISISRNGPIMSHLFLQMMPFYVVKLAVEMLE